MNCSFKQVTSHKLVFFFFFIFYIYFNKALFFCLYGIWWYHKLTKKSLLVIYQTHTYTYHLFWLNCFRLYNLVVISATHYYVPMNHFLKTSYICFNFIQPDIVSKQYIWLSTNKPKIVTSNKFQIYFYHKYILIKYSKCGNINCQKFD